MSNVSKYQSQGTTYHFKGRRYLSQGKACFARKRCEGSRNSKFSRRAGGIVPANIEPDQRWRDISLLRRQLQVAVSEEQYAEAARLKDYLAEVRSNLPPNQQFTRKLQELDFGSPSEQQAALAAIGEVGGMEILPEVAEYLKNPDLEKDAARALYSIWHRPSSNDPTVVGLMNQGCQLLMIHERLTSQQGAAQAREAIPKIFSAADQIFTEIIDRDPGFAEGWNKRATCRFYLGSFEDSIHDCEITLGINQYHFGAMVGKGFCHMKLRHYRPAASSFHRALQVHPGLIGIRKYLKVVELGAEQQEND